MRSTWRRNAVAGSLLIGVAAMLSSCGEDAVAPAAAPASRGPRALLAQGDFCVDADSCTATGAHARHAGYDCKVCHFVGGRLAFQKTGPAYGTGLPAPTFDATAKTCSNVACHSVAPGTFSYYFWVGDDEVELRTVSYGGGAAQTTPSWYATGVGCAACHPNPPRNGSTGSNVWHSGTHGSIDPNAATNQCQLCHPDATGSGGVGTAITNPSLHANGTVNVQANFRSSCFNCH
jgi:hypothetical protein